MAQPVEALEAGEKDRAYKGSWIVGLKRTQAGQYLRRGKLPQDRRQ
jgi:hypothetical protein